MHSYYAVQQMAQGASPLQAAQAAMTRIAGYYPTFNGAIIVVNTTGAIGKCRSGVRHITLCYWKTILHSYLCTVILYYCRHACVNNASNLMIIT